MTGVRANPGYVRIVEDGYNLFCIRFRVRKARGARILRLFAGLYIPNPRGFRDEDLSRARSHRRGGTFQSLLRGAVTSRVKY